MQNSLNILLNTEGNAKENIVINGNYLYEKEKNIYLHVYFQILTYLSLPHVKVK
jgi:hypothetical protein